MKSGTVPGTGVSFFPDVSSRGLVLVFLVALLVSLGSVQNHFVGDDLPIVKRNPLVHDLDVGTIFSSNYWGETSYGGLYRPLTILSYALNFKLLGRAPWGFHIVNCILHGLVAMVGLWCLTRVSLRRDVGQLGGLLIAASPIASEAVLSVVGRAELLSALFSLLALGFYASLRNENRIVSPLAWVLVPVSYLLALLSKEIAAGCFLAVVGGELFLRSPNRWGRIARGATLFGLPILAYLVARGLVLDGLSVPTNHTYFALLGAHGWERWLTATWAVAASLFLVVIPIDLCGDYSIGSLPLVVSFGDVRLIGAGVVLVIFLVAMLKGLGKRKFGTLGLFFFGCVLFPVSNLVIPIGVLLAERLLYLPSVGIHFAFSFGFLSLCRRLEGSRRVFAICLILSLVFLLSHRFASRAEDWRTNRTLSESVLRTYPMNAFANYNLGVVLFQEGKKKKAEEHFDRALSIRPGYEKAIVYKAGFLQQRGEMEKAHLLFLTILNHKPQERSRFEVYGRALQGRGALFVQEQRLGLAEKSLKEALTFLPDDPSLWGDLANILKMRGKVVEGDQARSRAVKLRKG